jgi:uncharacterized membrane protein YqjE
MVRHNHNSSGFGGLLGRFGRTAMRGINTRVELLAVEWQEERLRLRDLLLWSVALLFLVLSGALLITAAIIFLFPEDLRVYITAAFGLLYLCGAIAAWFGLKSGLKKEPFAESIDQVKKDQVWLESLE